MKKSINKEVAFKTNTIAMEELPFTTVLYPGHYGAFFAFKKDKREKPCFCSCAYEAIENYIKIRLLSPIPQNAYPDRMFILDSSHFPKSIVEDLMTKNLTYENVLSALNFKDKLCHECNRQTPSYKYCVEMYGGAFKQNYGWYINKQSYEWGIDPLNKLKQFLPETCPDELSALIEDSGFQKIKKEVESLNKEISDLGKEYYFGEYKNLGQKKKEMWDKYFLSLISKRNDLSKKFEKHYRKIQNVIENEVRRKFGHKKVGEAWTSETILYYIVKKLFPQYTVHRHHIPDFLQGLELDIFIEEIKIGIEYQGIQHYKPIKHWGGKEAFENLKERDKKKKEICKLKNVKLVYFNYNEGLSNDVVLEKLKQQ